MILFPNKLPLGSLGVEKREAFRIGVAHAPKNGSWPPPVDDDDSGASENRSISMSRMMLWEDPAVDTEPTEEGAGEDLTAEVGIEEELSMSLRYAPKSIFGMFG